MCLFVFQSLKIEITAKVKSTLCPKWSTKYQTNQLFALEEASHGTRPTTKSANQGFMEKKPQVPKTGGCPLKFLLYVKMILNKSEVYLASALSF